MIATAKTQYGSFQVFENDHIGRIMLSGQHYEAELINIILNNTLDKSGIALDVGANIGAHSAVYAQYFRKVYAFEPQSILTGLLRQNCPENVIVENYAIGHQYGNACIENDPVKKGEVNYGSRKLKTGAGSPVQVHALDDLQLTNVNLIKIDVEGAESLVIYGAQGIIKHQMPVLFFEYDKIREFLNSFHVSAREVRDFDVFAFLLDCGYRDFKRIGGKNVLVTP